jgi:outer membrane protein assembly factor BamB
MARIAITRLPGHTIMTHALLLLSALLFGADAVPRSWPGFLGRGATPVDPASIPLSWSHTENIAWKTKLPGKGQSSPVIWDQRVFTTSIEGSMKETCHVLALDLQTGGLVWDRAIPASQTVRSNYFQSRSAPTPLVDAERVYAFFETGNLLACNHSGEILWQRSLTDDFGPFESNIGLAASPLLVDDLVVLLIDHEGPSYLLAVDAATGKTRWKTDRDSRKSYASPSLLAIGGKPQIVCSSDGSVDGYDPTTGTRLWTFDDVGGNTSFTPLAVADGRFLIAAAPGMHNEREARAKRSNLCLRIDLTDQGYVPTVEWRTDQALPSFASPYAYLGRAYWINRAGVVFCFDAQTGEKKYAQRTKQPVWVTPVGIGDRLYVFGKDGLTTVLETGDEFKVVAENMLWDPEDADTDPFGRERAAAADTGGRGPATDPAKTQTDGRAAEGTESRRPAMSDKERDEARARGENRFPDPVQYGVAIVNGSVVIRTGETMYCVRQISPLSEKAK